MLINIAVGQALPFNNLYAIFQVHSQFLLEQLHPIECIKLLKGNRGVLENGPNAVEGGRDLWEVKSGELPWAVWHSKYHAVGLPLQPVLYTELPAPQPGTLLDSHQTAGMTQSQSIQKPVISVFVELSEIQLIN